MSKYIWWLNHHAKLPVNGTGGRHYSLAKSLQEHGYKLTIVNRTFDHIVGSFDKHNTESEINHIPLLGTYDGVDFCSIPTPPYKGNASIGRVRNMLAFYFGAMKYLRGKTELPKPDLINWLGGPSFCSLCRVQTAGSDMVEEDKRKNTPHSNTPNRLSQEDPGMEIKVARCCVLFS